MSRHYYCGPPVAEGHGHRDADSSEHRLGRRTAAPAGQEPIASFSTSLFLQVGAPARVEARGIDEAQRVAERIGHIERPLAPRPSRDLSHRQPTIAGPR